MDFNGLIRKFKQTQNLSGVPCFVSLRDIFTGIALLETTAFDYKAEGHFGVGDLFIKRISNAEKDLRPVSAVEQTAVSDLAKILTDTIPDHLFVNMRLTWVKPGGVVPKHMDQLRSYRRAKRIIIVIDAGTATLVCFKGMTPVNIDLKDGDVFELNNMSPHWMPNGGQKTTIILVIEMVHKDELNFYRNGLVIDPDRKVITTTSSTPTVVWDND